MLSREPGTLRKFCVLLSRAAGTKELTEHLGTVSKQTWPRTHFHSAHKAAYLKTGRAIPSNSQNPLPSIQSVLRYSDAFGASVIHMASNAAVWMDPSSLVDKLTNLMSFVSKTEYGQHCPLGL